MWGIIINPRSGKKAMRRQRKYLFQTLKVNRIKFIYEVTAYAGHATEIAYRFTGQGIKNILILGGDGTISEVINGIFRATNDASDMTIAIVPRGTGNDWGRYWGLTRDYQRSIDIFLKGKTQPIDIGQLELHRNQKAHHYYFINSVGFGLDCKVVQLTHRMKYYFGSHAILYFFALLGAVFTHKPRKMKITAGDTTFIGKVLTMNIGNGCFSGGGIKQNPDADPTDGLFHAMFVSRLTFKDIIKAVPHLFDGKLHTFAFMHNVCTDTIRIYTTKYLPFEADGIEVNACGPYTVSLIHNAINMLVP